MASLSHFLFLLLFVLISTFIFSNVHLMFGAWGTKNKSFRQGHADQSLFKQNWISGGINGKVQIERVSGEDTSRETGMLVLQRVFRILLGLKRSNKRSKPSNEEFDLSPAPEPQYEAATPAPASSMSTHKHSHTSDLPHLNLILPHQHRLPFQPKSIRKATVSQRTVIAVALSSGAAVLAGLLMVVLFYWRSGRSRKKALRRMRMGLHISYCLGRSSSKLSDSRNSITKGSFEPASELFYQNSRGPFPEQSCLNHEISNFNPSTNKAIASVMQKGTSSGEPTGYETDQESCSSVHINDTQKLESSDNESFHSVCDSHSSSLPPSNGSDYSHKNSAEISSSLYFSKKSPQPDNNFFKDPIPQSNIDSPTPPLTPDTIPPFPQRLDSPNSSPYSSKQTPLVESCNQEKVSILSPLSYPSQCGDPTLLNHGSISRADTQDFKGGSAFGAEKFSSQTWSSLMQMPPKSPCSIATSTNSISPTSSPDSSAQTPLTTEPGSLSEKGTPLAPNLSYPTQGDTPRFLKKDTSSAEEAKLIFTTEAPHPSSCPKQKPSETMLCSTCSKSKSTTTVSTTNPSNSESSIITTQILKPPPPPPPPLPSPIRYQFLPKPLQKPPQSFATQLVKSASSIPQPPCPAMLPTFLKGCNSIQPPPPPPLHRQQLTAIGKDGAPLPKLKPLHWDKVRAAPNRSMVWDKLRSSSFELDEGMMESLFGYNLRNSMKNEEVKSKTPSPSKHVLDHKRLQNITILSKALNATADEVCQALMKGDGLCAQQLEALVKMVPTKDEEDKLSNYQGDMDELGSAEKFVKAMIKIPFAFQRIEAMLYRDTFEDEVVHLKKSFAMLEEACKELRSSRLFLKLLEAVLKTGNRMNVGTIRGGARAFKLDALLKLADVKGTDGKTTLLHFVVQEIIRAEGIRISEITIQKTKQEAKHRSVEEKEQDFRMIGLDHVSGLSTELCNVKKTATVDLDVLASSVTNLSEGMVKLQKLVQKDLSTDYKSKSFVHSINSFLNHAEKNIKKLQEDENRVLLHVREITEYFHGDANKDDANPLRIFIIVRDFLGMLDQVCKEVRSLKGHSI